MPTADDKVQAITDAVNRYIALLAGGDVDQLVSCTRTTPWSRTRSAARSAP
jgi:hypothetical protein